MKLSILAMRSASGTAGNLKDRIKIFYDGHSIYTGIVSRSSPFPEERDLKKKKRKRGSDLARAGAARNERFLLRKKRRTDVHF